MNKALFLLERINLKNLLFLLIFLASLPIVALLTAVVFATLWFLTLVLIMTLSANYLFKLWLEHRTAWSPDQLETPPQPLATPRIFNPAPKVAACELPATTVATNVPVAPMEQTDDKSVHVHDLEWSNRMEKALARVASGEKIRTVARQLKLPESTLRSKLKKLHKGVNPCT